MRVDVVAFGKLKTPGLREAADHYLKVASKFLEIQERELKPLSVPDKSAAKRTQIQVREAELLLTGIKSGERSCLILLDEGGKTLRTEAWATMIDSWRNDGFTQVAIGIGSSLGFSAELKRKARAVLSLGPQTLPHELARVVLYEQLFRASSLLAGHPYHVEG